MCGICGIIDFSHHAVQESSVQQMMKTMKHRGPDDEGCIVEENYALGHVRLSIIDLSSDGRQPMQSDDERYLISFNGEIYNYIEIREELEGEFNFKTQTDTEVLLYAYIKWGAECLNKFNGMFAFAIYDRRDKKWFIARDRFGIKPLYYFLNNNKLIFSSEIRPILTVTGKVEANDRVIYDFLVQSRVQHNEYTFFEGIKKLQHGHFLEITKNEVKITRWYHLGNELKKPFINSEEFKNSLSDSLSKRLRSDVEVGACLSGGLDSSTIVSLMQRSSNLNKFHTFSAMYESDDIGDEREFISCYDEEPIHMHETKPNAESLLQDLKEYVQCLEEPVPGLSEYAEYKVMELAKKNATVILNGQGADEVLAGYHYFFGFYFKELLMKGKLYSFFREMIYYLKEHRAFLGISSFVFFMLPGYFQKKILEGKSGFVNIHKLKSSLKNSNDLLKLYKSKTLKEASLNHFEYKFEHHLIWGDKSSMKHSLELRFPFLDHRLVEQSIGMKSEMLIKKAQTKFILREAMRNIIPEKIRSRKDKVGFETPSGKWLRQEKMQDLANEIFNSDNFVKRNYFKPKKLLQMLNEHKNGVKDHSNALWKAIHLELWFREFID